MLFRFYVKSILENLEAEKNCLFCYLVALNFVDLLNLRLQRKTKIHEIQNSEPLNSQ